MKKWRSWLAFMAAGLTVLGGLSDYLGWSDKWFGREKALNLIQRLSVPNSDTFVFDNDKDFVAAWNFIRCNTLNPKVRDGKTATGICKIGTPIKLQTGVSVPEYVFRDSFVPDATPLLVCYNLRAPWMPLDEQKANNVHAEHIGTLADIRSWIIAHKERERFFVSIGLIGVASLAIASGELREKKGNK